MEFLELKTAVTKKKNSLNQVNQSKAKKADRISEGQDRLIEII